MWDSAYLKAVLGSCKTALIIDMLLRGSVNPTIPISTGSNNETLNAEADGYKERRKVRVYAHFQNQDVAGGGLKGVQEADQERVLDVLQDSKLVGDLVTLHQLLVHKLSGHCSFGSPLVTFLNDREPAPGTQVGRNCQASENVMEKRLSGPPWPGRLLTEPVHTPHDGPQAARLCPSPSAV